jgi:hypothetical protein
MYPCKKSKVLGRTMGTSNRDASQVTVKNRNKAENSYYNDWKNATMTTGGAPGNMALKAPANTSAEVLSEIKLGCTACVAENGNDPNQPRYPFNPSSGNNNTNAN